MARDFFLLPGVLQVPLPRTDKSATIPHPTRSRFVSIHGYDPLEGVTAGNPNLLDSVAHRNVVNILKSYTGFYDLFAEAIQNALDAIQRKAAATNVGYTPRVWVNIDLQTKAVELVDNGIGMTEEEFKLCFTPNVSFK